VEDGTQQQLAFERVVNRRVSARYLLYLPREYSARPRGWPLLLSLHGGGERGDDLHLLTRHGIPKLVAEGQHFPCIVVAPQCPADAWWSAEVLLALLDEVEGTHAIDVDRAYVTGYSIGGFGTWALALAAPRRFAALAPICGGGEYWRAETIAHLPIWAFHGARDTRVPLRIGAEMVEALARCGGNVRFTVYPEAAHNAWAQTYANPELYSWLLAQVRQHNPATPN